MINAAELATGQTISGTVVNAEAGNTVTVSVGGHNYTATVQSDLTGPSAYRNLCSPRWAMAI